LNNITLPAQTPFTATTCGDSVLPLNITGGSTVGYGTPTTIGVTETYSAYTWTFTSQSFSGECFTLTGQNPNPTLQWDGVWDVKVVAEDGLGGVGFDSTTVEITRGLRYNDLAYTANTGGGGYVGASNFFKSGSTCYNNATDNFVIFVDEQLDGDGGYIFRMGVDGIRMVGFDSVPDYPSSKNEYLSPTCQWAYYKTTPTSLQIKDGAAFPTLATVDLSTMKWFRIDRTSGSFKLATADTPNSSNWTNIHGFSVVDTADLYVKVYIHSGANSNYFEALKYGTYV